MIDRRRFLLTSLAGALAAPLGGEAQPAGQIWRIGLLDPSGRASSSRWTAFRERLRELGYAEGQNVLFESRWGDGQLSRLPSLARELVNARVDIVVAAGSESTRAVTLVTNSVPVVMATGGDVVGLGLVSSLAHPGGNVTGVVSLTGELGGKRLERLRQLIPAVSTVTIVRNLDNRGTRPFLNDAERAAKSLGIVVQVVGVHGPKDLDGAFSAMKRARTDAVMFADNSLFINERRHVADLAVTHRLPMMAPAKEYAEAGVLVSYGTDYLDLFRRAATYVNKILKGARPGDLPIEQPTKFELVINLKTAKALGLSVPPSLLARADQIIE